MERVFFNCRGCKLRFWQESTFVPKSQLTAYYNFFYVASAIAECGSLYILSLKSNTDFRLYEKLSLNKSYVVLFQCCLS